MFRAVSLLLVGSLLHSIYGEDTKGCPQLLNKNSARKNLVEASTLSKRKCEEYSYFTCGYEEADVFTDSDPVLTNYCVIPAAPLVVGGISVEPQEFPHMALLGVGDDRDNITYHCGGSLIAPNFVLTAAHCLSRGRSQYVRWVLLGDIDRSSTDDEAEPQLLEVAARFTPPDWFKPFERFNDIALLRLSTEAVMTRFVRPACLYSEPSLEANIDAFLVTGWGETAAGGGGEPSNMLQKAVVYDLPNSACRDYKFDTLYFPRGVLAEAHVCAGNLSGGTDICKMDSGSPLQFFRHEKPSCMHHIVGIVSIGGGCGLRRSASVYTRVSAYIPWIESVVWPPS